MSQPYYRSTTDEDPTAIWANLRSLPPIKNQVSFAIPLAAGQWVLA
jgi:hypothetical protein